MTVYDIITNEIIKKLEDGVIPWQKPFLGIDHPPMNFKTKKAYRGINHLLLHLQGYKSPYWLTYLQAQEITGLDKPIKKGSKGNRIMFAKMIEVENQNGKIENKPIFRYSTVFNLTSVEGLECPFKDDNKEEVREFHYLENCDNMIQEMHVNKLIPQIVEHEKNRACYSPSEDLIYSCRKEEYVSENAYYSTMFHEIIHSTGHKNRLVRNMTGHFGTQLYAKEELVAEIGACFLCGMAGIKTMTIDNSASYIQGWLEHIRNDKSLIIMASSKAEEAVKYLGVEKHELEEVKE